MFTCCLGRSCNGKWLLGGRNRLILNRKAEEKLKNQLLKGKIFVPLKRAEWHVNTLSSRKKKKKKGKIKQNRTEQNNNKKKHIKYDIQITTPKPGGMVELLGKIWRCNTENTSNLQGPAFMLSVLMLQWKNTKQKKKTMLSWLKLQRTNRGSVTSTSLIFESGDVLAASDALDLRTYFSLLINSVNGFRQMGKISYLETKTMFSLFILEVV